MIEVAAASLNTLPYPAVSPTENTILSQVLSELQSLRSEVAQLREETVQDRKEIEALKVKLTALEFTQEQDITRICVDIAQDRQRISRLEHKESQPTEVRGEKTIARIEQLKAVMKSKGGSITFGEAERLLKIKPNQMTALVSQLDKRSFEVFTRSGDSRQRVLRLKARINVSRER